MSETDSIILIFIKLDIVASGVTDYLMRRHVRSVLQMRYIHNLVIFIHIIQKTIRNKTRFSTTKDLVILIRV